MRISVLCCSFVNIILHWFASIIEHDALNSKCELGSSEIPSAVQHFWYQGLTASYVKLNIDVRVTGQHNTLMLNVETAANFLLMPQFYKNT